MNKTLEQRFLEKVVWIGRCWEWTAFKNRKGYGIFKLNGRHVGAHRISYELYISEIPKGLLCLHRCDNPSCVNPKHLFLGTNQDNMNDMKSKGRKPKGSDSYRAKLTWEQVVDIRSFVKCGASEADMARRHNVNPSCINKIINNKTWVAE